MTKIRIGVFLAGLAMTAAALRFYFVQGIGNNLYFAAGISAFLFFYGWQFKRLIKIKWLNFLVALCILFFTGLSVFIAWYGSHGTAMYTEDAALVLGGGSREGRVLPILQNRLDKTIEYHQKNPGALIVVTGGKGDREDIPESMIMENYLRENGVPADRIVREETSLSTWENMKYSKLVLDQYFNNGFTAVVITSDFHQYRSERFARQAGMEVTRLPAATPWYLLPAQYIRECAAVIKLWLFKI